MSAVRYLISIDFLKGGREIENQSLNVWDLFLALTFVKCLNSSLATSYVGISKFDGIGARVTKGANKRNTWMDK